VTAGFVFDFLNRCREDFLFMEDHTKPVSGSSEKPQLRPKDDGELEHFMDTFCVAWNESRRAIRNTYDGEQFPSGVVCALLNSACLLIRFPIPCMSKLLSYN
jgi:hypothetical protein